MSPWSHLVELLWPDFSAQVFPLPAELNTCINTSSHQHHSSMPVFNTSLPLDCRDSLAALLLLKSWNISQTLQLEGGRGQACSTLCRSGHPLPMSVGTCTLAELMGEPKSGELSRKHPASLLSEQCACGLMPLKGHSWCLSAPVSASVFALRVLTLPSFAVLLIRDSFAVFQPCQRYQWRGERSTSLSGHCCAKLPPASRDQHPWQTHQDMSCLASAEHEPGKGWGHPWQRNSRGKSKAISVQTTTFPVLG